jgi:DNA-binding MarR family transcriptional regulator
MNPTTFPTVLRELLRTNQIFLSYAASDVNKLDLTLPQYDVIITLGGTAGMPYKKLGEKTLITKGTLTGVVSRLESKGLVERTASKKDGRSQILRLTEEGNDIFERSFPLHLDYLNHLFTDYSAEDVATLETALIRLQKAVSDCRGSDVDNKISE